MLSADGSRAGFCGVTVGRGHVYLAVDDAICVQGSRHASPSKWCDCGFYCFHDVASARDLACEPEHRNAVLLEVAASGRYRRYERGLRYSRQRVRSVHVSRCDCGQARHRARRHRRRAAPAGASSSRRVWPAWAPGPGWNCRRSPGWRATG